MDLDSALEQALKYASRREELSNTEVTCPECRTEQVQLVDWFSYPVHYKCRKCRTEFSIG